MRDRDGSRGGGGRSAGGGKPSHAKPRRSKPHRSKSGGFTRGRSKPGQGRPLPVAPARFVAHRALAAFARGAATRIDGAVDHALAARGGKPLDRRDVHLAQELARGVVRQQGFLDAALECFATRGLPDDVGTRTALRLGAYQLLCLSRVPPHAAVGESVALLGRVHSSQRAFVNAVLRGLARGVADSAERTDDANPADPGASVDASDSADPAGPLAASDLVWIALDDGRFLCVPRDRDVFGDPDSDPLAYAALRYSLPRFLLDGWARALGVPQAVELARRSIRTPGVTLRVQPQRTTRDDLARALADAGVETAPVTDTPFSERVEQQLLTWTGGRPPFGTEPFVAGQCSVQDPTALAAAQAVDPAPDATVFDPCAAPGGKATALAERLGPDGHVHAWDLDPDRRERIREAAVRLALSDRLTVHDDRSSVPLCDHALVDVPCSNTGVLARRVEVRHRLQPDVIRDLAERQRRLLAETVAHVRPGGRIVYSTCSIELTENQAVVEAVAAEHHLEVLEQTLTLPNAPHYDGGFYAVMRRPSDGAEGSATGSESAFGV